MLLQVSTIFAREKLGEKKLLPLIEGGKIGQLKRNMQASYARGNMKWSSKYVSLLFYFPKWLWVDFQFSEGMRPAIKIKFIHLLCHLFLYQIRPKFCSTFNQSLLRILPVNYKIHDWESESESCSVVSDSLQPHGLYSPWNSPG